MQQNLSPILENDRVRLTPLALADVPKLLAVASQENLVQYSPSDIYTPQALEHYIATALAQKQNETSIPFLVFDKQAQQYAGSTRYMNIHWKNKVLEIGSTWIGREFQGSGLNTRMKHLMIDHAFDHMDFEKIEFRVDERNIRSRKAVEKLGGVLEGILRKNVYLLDGFKRNTCCYGILKEDWNAQKES